MSFREYLNEEQLLDESTNDFFQAQADVNLNKILEKNFRGWVATRNKKGKLDFIHLSGKVVTSPKKATFSNLSKLLKLDDET